MRLLIKLETAVLGCMLLGDASSVLAQQKGQWVPGQFGLNAGAIPEPGVTYANLALNYSASRLNDSSGNRVFQNVTGTYAFWVDENIFTTSRNKSFSAGTACPTSHSTTRAASWWLTLAWQRITSDRKSVV